jgi:SAM-dependent methyltransferase
MEPRRGPAKSPAPRKGPQESWRIEPGEHYLDAFLGELKRRANLGLVLRWRDPGVTGRPVLKTDLFEEAFGPDAFLDDLGPPGSMVVGMDLSVGVAAAARRRDAQRRRRIVVADARRLPFADGSFSLLVSPSTLDHFRDPGGLGLSLRELLRVTAPGGRLVVTLDNRHNVFDPLLRLVNRLGMVPYYLGRSYSVRELRRALTTSGWRVLDTTAILHNPRLVATGLVALARRLGWPPFTRLVRRLLVAAQGLESTRLRYLTGSFVAALAAPEVGGSATEEPDGPT